MPTTGDGDAETRAGACAGPGFYDCQDIEGRSMPDLELNLTKTCSDSGITCLNSEQKPGRSCPDFKVRYVCTCPGMQFGVLSLYYFLARFNFPSFWRLEQNAQ